MSIFGSIMSKIFGGAASAQAAAPNASETPSVSAAAQGRDGPTGSASSAAAPSMSGAPSPAAEGQAGVAGQANVDVGQVLADLAAGKGQTLDYKRSIVDLLKLLDLDSSLQARKQLADELHYTGDKEDSATMNVWLHKQVVQKLAENGGKVPDDLKHA